MPRTGDGRIPDEPHSPEGSKHPRFLGATFLEGLSGIPLAERVPGTWESVDASAVKEADVGHVALRFTEAGTVEMASYSSDGAPAVRQDGTYAIEDEGLEAVFPGNLKATVTFEEDALIMEDSSNGSKVRFRKRSQDLPLEEAPSEGGA